MPLSLYSSSSLDSFPFPLVLAQRERERDCVEVGGGRVDGRREVGGKEVTSRGVVGKSVTSYIAWEWDVLICINAPSLT
jgi:hypothetical protein